MKLRRLISYSVRRYSSYVQEYKGRVISSRLDRREQEITVVKLVVNGLIFFKRQNRESNLFSIKAEVVEL